jgi:hypothetical protein
MTKIVVSLRSVFIIYAWYFQHENQKSVNESYSLPCFPLFLKSIEYLNFRHFTILGISWGNLIFTQKDLAT